MICALTTSAMPTHNGEPGADCFSRALRTVSQALDKMLFVDSHVVRRPKAVEVSRTTATDLRVAPPERFSLLNQAFGLLEAQLLVSGAAYPLMCISAFQARPAA